jgi:hypothetical protein
MRSKYDRKHSGNNCETENQAESLVETPEIRRLAFVRDLQKESSREK